jgi:predicted ribosome quality control (RQC) complex YloA/Tae2 family protein
MVKFTLDIRKSVEANASVYFEKAKKAKKKMEGARAAMSRTRDKLKKLLFEKEEVSKNLAAESEDRIKAAERQSASVWYHKFRWFTSSEGFLCIGGRDSTTNEIIIKKYTGKDDLVFHTELPGSPFFVIQKTSKPELAIGNSTIQEAAIATAAYSRAWKSKIQSPDVYWVKPEQVSKETRPGESIGKGAFMILGKKNFVNIKAEVAVGIASDGRLMGGPDAAVSKNCEKFVKILQGDNKPSDAAKKIVKLLGLSSTCLDEIIRVLPPGEVKVVKI